MKIEFRGKAKGSIEELEEIGIKHTNGWIYGNYVDGFIVIGDREQWSDVDPKTVGQYTNVNTHQGEKIFDGDVVTTNYFREYSFNQYATIPLIGVVEFLEGMWVVNNRVDKMIPLWSETNEIQILGNIHDNPELLEVSE